MFSMQSKRKKVEKLVAPRLDLIDLLFGLSSARQISKKIGGYKFLYVAWRLLIIYVISKPLDQSQFLILPIFPSINERFYSFSANQIN